MEATFHRISVKLPDGLKQGCMSHSGTDVGLNFKGRIKFQFCKVRAISVTMGTHKTVCVAEMSRKGDMLTGIT